MTAPLNNLSPEEINAELDLISDSDITLTHEMMAFVSFHAENKKSEIDLITAEINQRNDKMRLINDIITEINNLTDEKNGLDIGQNAELLEKLQAADKLGVKINKLNDGKIKSKFNAIERDRLIENLHLKADSWDKENRHQTQQMEIRIKALDRLMMILSDIEKKTNQMVRPIVAGIRGAGG